MWPVEPLYILRSGLAVAMAAGFLYIAYATGIAACASRNILNRWVCTIAALLLLPAAIFHGLSAVHLFAPVPAAVALGLFAAVAGHLVDPSRVRHRFRRDLVFLRRLKARFTKSPFRWVVVAYVICASPGLLHALLLPPLGWDTLTYHAVKASMYVQNGGVDSMSGTGPWGYYQNLSGGGEIFTAWAMLPLHADDLAPALEVGEWLALGFVLMVLARQFSVREPLASTASGFFLALPTVKLLVGSGYVELLMLLAFATGATLGLRAAAGAGAGVLALALGALGLSAATKATMVPLAAAVGLVFSVQALRTVGWIGVGGAISAFGLMLLPWLIRTVVRTGLPFSPLPVTVGGVPLGRPSPELRWYMRRPALHPYVLETELRVLRRLFPWPWAAAGAEREALGALALLPAIVFVRGFASLVSRLRPAALLVGLSVVITLALYYSRDFSMIRHYWTETSSRFLLPLILMLTITSAVWSRRRSRAARMYVLVLQSAALFNLIGTAAVGFSRTSMVGISVLVAGMTALGIATRVAANARRPLAWMALIMLAVIVGLHGLRASLRYDLYTNDFSLEPVPKYWVAALPWIDHTAEPQRVAVTSGPLQNLDNWFVSPFFGSRLQNSIVYEPLSEDGRIWPLGSEDLIRMANFNAWNRRIHEEGVSSVMSFSPRSIEQEWMEAHPRSFDKLCGDRNWGLFAVK